MRCPDCGIFVAYGEPEIDGEASVDGEEVRVTAEVALTCEQCGTSLKTASIEGEMAIASEKDCAGEGADKLDEAAHEWEVEDETFDPAERTEGKGRGMRTFYGYTATITLKCQREGCNAEREVEVTADEQASSFEEC